MKGWGTAKVVGRAAKASRREAKVRRGEEEERQRGAKVDSRQAKHKAEVVV